MQWNYIELKKIHETDGESEEYKLVNHQKNKKWGPPRKQSLCSAKMDTDVQKGNLYYGLSEVC